MPSNMPRNAVRKLFSLVHRRNTFLIEEKNNVVYGIPKINGKVNNIRSHTIIERIRHKRRERWNYLLVTSTNNITCTIMFLLYIDTSFFFVFAWLSSSKITCSNFKRYGLTKSKRINIILTYNIIYLVQYFLFIVIKAGQVYDFFNLS